MSTTSPAINDTRGAFAGDSSRAFLFGMALSIVIHGAIFWLAQWLRFFDLQTEPIVDKEESRFVEVGLVVKKPAQPERANQNRNDGDPAKKSPHPRFVNPDKLTAKRPEVPNKAPVEPILPGGNRKTIGPGPSPPVFHPGSNNPLVAPNGLRKETPTGSNATGKGQHAARFFNIADPGKRVVYAIDRSGSMSSDVILSGGRRIDLLTVAKAELKASLNRLTPQHRFLVLFYNDAVLPLTVDRQNGRKLQLLPANAHYLGKVKPRIDAVRVSGNTEHIRALRAALKLKPEVIYFLTDAQSGLQSAELAEVRRLNRGQNTRIHCIHFGKGTQLPRNENFLKELAKMTGGGYRYRNIESFRRR